MTIVFQGHVSRVESAGIGQIAVTLHTPMEEAGGKEWVIFVPKTSAVNWLVGRIAQFTIYSFDAETAAPPSSGERKASESKASDE
jgi:hypothetical protein